MFPETSQKDNWIKIEKEGKRPEPGQKIIISHSGEVDAAHWDGDSEWGIPETSFTIDFQSEWERDVTHVDYWMPFPAPYKEPAYELISINGTLFKKFISSNEEGFPNLSPFIWGDLFSINHTNS